MRYPLAMLALAPLLAGCSLSYRTLAPLGVASYARDVNAADGSNLPSVMLVNGYDIGGDLYGGGVGLHYSNQKGRIEDGAAGLSLRAKTYEFRIGSPDPWRVGPAVVFPLMGIGLRTVEAWGKNTYDDDMAFVLRPMLHAAVPLGRVMVVGNVGYDLSFVGEALAVHPSVPLSSNLHGPSASVGLLVNLCPGC